MTVARSIAVEIVDALLCQRCWRIRPCRCERTPVMNCEHNDTALDSRGRLVCDNCGEVLVR